VDPKEVPEIPNAAGRTVDSSRALAESIGLSSNWERAARLSLRLGDQAVRRRRRKSGPVAPDLACGLYRQSAYYSLRVLGLLSAPTDEAGGDASFASVFRAAPRDALERAAGGAERVSALEPRLCQSTFVDFAGSEPAEASAFALELSAFARGLLKALELRQRRIEIGAASRSLRVLGFGVLVAVLGVMLVLVPAWLTARSDLAAGKPWQASSLYWERGCESPLQDCPGDKAYFMHTNQENDPWLEIDLKSTQKMSKAEVINRTDCCIDRVVPLVLEVSSDQKTWREVARSTAPFHEWKPTFAPVSARWVRLRVPRYSMLHLKRVRIFP
jgi:hypothetical protein